MRRGLKFSTTPKPNTIELKSDAQEFTRKLRLTLKSLIALKKQEKVFLVLYLKTKGTFTHPVIETKFLTLPLILTIKEDWQALRELKNDKIIIIKANKGWTVDVMDSVHYEQRIYKQLEDKNTYKKSRSIL